jgi:hypothetical protein
MNQQLKSLGHSRLLKAKEKKGHILLRRTARIACQHREEATQCKTGGLQFDCWDDRNISVLHHAPPPGLYKTMCVGVWLITSSQ